jgi:hypothetical protein
MMQHRRYFSVMGDHTTNLNRGSLNQFSAIPYGALDPSWNTDQPGWMWNKYHQQSHNDFNHDLPSNYNDGYTVTKVTPPAATGTGTSVGTTTLTVTSVTNKILAGATVSGTGVPAGTTIVSGPGGAGTYVTNQPTTLSNAALTFTHAPYDQGNAMSGGRFGIPQAQILIEGNGGSQENRSWWTFVNHQQHFIANDAILPLPTTSSMTAGTPPGQITASNPWWWAARAPVNYPFW